VSLATAILTRSVPAAGWLKSYEGKWLRADLIAGLTLAAYLLPAGIGDASLAGLPPQAGIYACLFSGLVFLVILQFATHRNHCHFRNFSANRIVPRRDGSR
jgi:MFS superfamily sulfate permease-like transporter